MNKMVPEIFPRGIPTHETPPGKFPPENSYLKYSHPFHCLSSLNTSF